LVVSYSSSTSDFSILSTKKDVPSEYTYDFKRYGLSIYTDFSIKKASTTKDLGFFSLPKLISESSDYTKGEYHIASDRQIFGEEAKIEKKDSFQIEKDSSSLEIK
jgi:hypothetical protein